MEKLGERKEKLGAYFRGRSLYADDQLAEAVGVTAGELDELLVWYARLELGEKIRKCVEEKGDCSFEAEL